MSEVAAQLRWFGTRRPGAAEKVLARAKGGDHSPYEWLQRAVADSASQVLDLACGTGQLTRRLARADRLVIGLDLSESNLVQARKLGGGCWVQADVGYLPFADGSFNAVVTSLGLGVVADRVQFLKEVARVLRPGGVFAALVPSMRPFNVDDLRIASQLAGYLRTTPHLPGSAEFRAKTSLAQVGLTKMEDARARYHFQVANREDAQVLIEGLRQAPDQARASAAVDFLTRTAADAPVQVPLPIRRIVAIK